MSNNNHHQQHYNHSSTVLSQHGVPMRNTHTGGNIPHDDSQMTIDKRVSLGLVAAIILQTFGVGWWAATTTAEIKTLTEKVELYTADRVTKTEYKLKNNLWEEKVSRLSDEIHRLDIRVKELENGTKGR